MDNIGVTPLHYAAQLKDTSFARKLIEAGADVNAHGQNVKIETEEDDPTQGDLVTPLDYAVWGLNTPGVALLLEKGADVRLGSPLRHLDHRPLSGHSDPLEKAEQHDDILAIARLLLNYNADMTIRDEEWGGQVIHHAAAVGYPDLVGLLLDHGANIEAGDKDKTTPLGIAAQWGEVQTMELLLKRGARISARDNLGNTPLMYAISSRNVEAIKLLLREKKLDVATPNKDGLTTLMLAAYYEETDDDVYPGGVRDDLQKMLNERKLSDIEQRAFQDDIRMVAYEKWLPELAKILVQRGCKINAVDATGRSALHHAAYIGRTALVRFLLAHDAKVNQADHEGNTPLHLAVERNNAAVVELLLKNGASINARNKAGLSALDIANCEHAQAAAAILVKHKARAWKFTRMQ